MDSLNPNMDYKEYNPFLNKTKFNKFTQEQLSYIQELLALGWSASRIANTYHLSLQSLKERIKNNNWDVAKSVRSSKLTQQEINEIHQKVLNGEDHQKIAEEYDISIFTLEKRIANNYWEWKPSKKNKYSFDENYFDEINNEHKAYWLGFLMADGYILSKRNRGHGDEAQSFGFTISIDDIDIAQKFKEDLKATNPINIYENKGQGRFKPGSKSCRILLTSQHTVDSLKKHGIVENKTFFTTMPELREDLIPHFIRGYSDGDGSIVNYISKQKETGILFHKSHWALCGTRELLESFKQYFHKEDLKLYQRWPERNVNNYELRISGKQQCIKLLGIIYKDCTICLKRKYDKYAEMQGKNV